MYVAVEKTKQDYNIRRFDELRSIRIKSCRGFVFVLLLDFFFFRMGGNEGVSLRSIDLIGCDSLVAFFVVRHCVTSGTRCLPMWHTSRGCSNGERLTHRSC